MESSSETFHRHMNWGGRDIHGPYPRHGMIWASHLEFDILKGWKDGGVECYQNDGSYWVHFKTRKGKKFSSQIEPWMVRAAASSISHYKRLKRDELANTLIRFYRRNFSSNVFSFAERAIQDGRYEHASQVTVLMTKEDQIRSAINRVCAMLSDRGPFTLTGMARENELKTLPYELRSRPVLKAFREGKDPGEVLALYHELN